MILNISSESGFYKGYKLNLQEFEKTWCKFIMIPRKWFKKNFFLMQYIYIYIYIQLWYEFNITTFLISTIFTVLRDFHNVPIA